MYVSQGSPAQSDGCRYIRESALHKHHIRCIYGDIGTCTYGYSYVGSRKGRSIVYAVADHGSFSILHKLSDHGLLAVRKHSGYDLVHPCFPAYGLGSLFVISRQHDHSYAHGLKLLDGLGAVFLYDIRNGDYTIKPSFLSKEEGSFSGTGKSSGGSYGFCGDISHPAYEGPVSSVYGCALDSAGEPVSCYRLEIICGRHIY